MKLLPEHTPQGCLLRIVFIIVILAILASISVPTHTGPHHVIRSKVSRVRNDHRTIARALEIYYQEYSTFPVPVFMADWFAVPGRPSARANVNAARDYLAAQGADRLTTFRKDGLVEEYSGPERIRHGNNLPLPLHYGAPTDPFGKPLPGSAGSLPFTYYSTGEEWIMASIGPDGKFDLDPSADWDPQTSPSLPRLVHKTYDPTNGAMSAGDIWLDRKTFREWNAKYGDENRETTSAVTRQTR